MPNLQNTNNEIYQQLMDMNKSFSGGGGGAMGTQIDQCSSFEKGTPEYTACQDRLKNMSKYFKADPNAVSYNSNGSPVYKDKNGNEYSPV